MKKGDEIRQMFNTRVAILIEKEGVLHAYLSHNDFLQVLPGTLSPANKRTPENFMTVAQLNGIRRGSTKAEEEVEEAIESQTFEDGPVDTVTVTGRSSTRSPGKRIAVSYFENSVNASRE